jgi:hypothetical protein
LIVATGAEFGTRHALTIAYDEKPMLRITINDDRNETTMKLEGRVAGLWTAELSKVWMETASQLSSKKLVLDIRDVTFADANGIQQLSTIYMQTHARVLADTLWARSLCDQITRSDARSLVEER